MNEKLNCKTEPMLKLSVMKFLYFILIGLCYCFCSCTVLQWRASDKEIYEKYEALDIPTEITYFDIDSLDLKIRIQGVSSATSKHNLVYFHGSPSSMSAWDGYLTDSTLTKRANSYTIDRPGYGYSNFGEAMTSIDLQAQIMSALMRDKGLENVIAVGSSYGGPLAARLAVINPNIVGVIMVSPAIDPTNEKKIWQSKFTQWSLTRWLVPTGYRVAGDEKTVHARELAKIQADWPSVQVPVIHIHGDQDDIVPYENIHYTKEVFPNITIITTPDTGHEIAWGRPELIKPHILELINSLEEKEN